VEEDAAAERPMEGEDIRWVIRRFARALGRARLAGLVILGTVGSLAVLAIGFAAIVIVQLAASDRGERIRGIAVPDVALPVLLFGVVLTSVVGVAALLGAERMSREGAGRCTSMLRADIRRTGHAPASVLVQDVRSVGNSGLVLARLPGPIFVVLGAASLLLLLDSRLTVLLAPFALVMVFVGRRMRLNAEALSVVLERSRARVVELSREVDEAVESDELVGEASAGDAATFRLAGQTSRSQAAGLASVGIMVIIAVLGTGFADDTSDAGDIARLIIYVIVARLLVRSLQQIAATRSAISRHASAIRRCRAALVGDDADSG
jgi:hypothetical protein